MDIIKTIKEHKNDKGYFVKNIVFWLISLIAIFPTLMPIMFWAVVGFFVNIDDEPLVGIFEILMPFFILVMFKKCAESLLVNKVVWSDLCLLYISIGYTCLYFAKFGFKFLFKD